MCLSSKLLVGCYTPPPARTWQLSTERSVCELHNITTLPDRVHIEYGLFDRGFLLARDKYFPNAWTWVGGGCVEQEKKTQEVKYCPKCREEEKRFNQMDEKTRQKICGKLVTLERQNRPHQPPAWPKRNL